MTLSAILLEQSILLDAFSRNGNEFFELIVLHSGHASEFLFEILRKHEKIVALSVDHNFWFLVYTNDELKKRKKFHTEGGKLFIFSKIFFHFLFFISVSSSSMESRAFRRKPSCKYRISFLLLLRILRKCCIQKISDCKIMFFCRQIKNKYQKTVFKKDMALHYINFSFFSQFFSG